MKNSKYNYFFEGKGCMVAHNALTGALAEISYNDYEDYKKYINKITDKIDDDLYANLIHGGYIIKDNVDELEIIRHDMLASRFRNDVLNLTLAPTSNCNFRCPYCFENSVLRKASMDQNTKNNIIKFVEDQANQLTQLNITWYGGEPLLEINSICSMTEKFLNICQKNNIEYYSGIITNGYYLTENNMLKLINAQIKHIQITLDGPKEIHDCRRYLVGGKPTFDTIMNNLYQLKNIYLGNDTKHTQLPEISVRMNIDRTNVSKISDLLNLFDKEPLKRYIKFYIAGVYDKDDKQHLNTFSPKEYKEIEKNFISKLKECGFLDKNGLNYPKRIFANCGCDSYSAFVIDSDGRIYKCWEEIGQIEYSVGNINDSIINERTSLYYKYLLNDPTVKEKCSSCCILPICMGGGCPSHIIKDGEKLDCSSLIESSRHLIKESYFEIKNLTIN